VRVLRLGVIGCGYWGPNLVRNFSSIPGARVLVVCDIDPRRLHSVQADYPLIEATTDAASIIARTNLDAVAIATPVSTHFDLALAALRAGKHVLVEKPLAASSEEAMRLIDEAEKRNLVLMVDHTFVYSGTVRTVRDLITNDGVGDISYYDAVRVNLGIFRHDVNVLWDLAVHDLSIMDYLLAQQPCTVSATGARHVAGETENIAYVTVFFENNLIAHVHANWLAPVKIRHTLLGGTKKLIVCNDLEPIEKVRVYDSGIELTEDPDNTRRLRIGYRTGAMWAPPVDSTEALRTEALHFVDCVSDGKRPITDGHAGLRVIRILEAATESIAQQGRPVDLAREGVQA
jgi:predicted dehydrogenase